MSLLKLVKTNISEIIDINLIIIMKKNLSFSILLVLGLFYSITILGQNLVVGSYNIRYDNGGDVSNGHAWVDRYPWMTKQIMYNDFDILGTQEVLHHQLQDLTSHLEGYSYVGVGRDDGETKGSMLLFFTKTVECNF